MSEPRQSFARPQSVSAILDGIIDPHPAEYRGVAMRSQLEADFAKHLDNTGLRDWQYEPQTFRGERDPGYIPDFTVTLNGRACYYEVKPTLAEVRAASHRMEVVWETDPDAILVVVCGEQCKFFTALRGHPWESWVERWAHG